MKILRPEYIMPPARMQSGECRAENAELLDEQTINPTLGEALCGEI